MIAVLLLGFGGPDSLEAVEPFLENLFGDKEKAKSRAPAVIERYKQIGGRSPFLEIAREQAQRLEGQLNKNEGLFKVYLGMRYWHPLIEEAVNQILADGIRQIIALSLSPHNSRTTTGAFITKLKQSLAEQTREINLLLAKDWFEHPAYLDALKEKIITTLARFPKENRSDLQVIFSAHSLPKAFIEGGDPYLEQVEATIEGLIKRIGPISWHLSFQSQSGPGEWLGPETGALLEKLAKQGHRQVLLVPVSFIYDQVEILYDIDIVYRKQAESLGIKDFQRTESLNASPKFIEALSQIVKETISQYTI